MCTVYIKYSTSLSIYTLLPYHTITSAMTKWCRSPKVYTAYCNTCKYILYIHMHTYEAYRSKDDFFTTHTLFSFTIFCPVFLLWYFIRRLPNTFLGPFQTGGRSTYIMEWFWLCCVHWGPSRQTTICGRLWSRFSSGLHLGLVRWSSSMGSTNWDGSRMDGSARYWCWCLTGWRFWNDRINKLKWTPTYVRMYVCTSSIMTH